ncbi:hypothetical protein QZM46_17525 [Burkholderia vietnamiensis]|uniref:hypothetical protein n=1 Tax=Burkholderia TaxID=32008 RepID=UPI00264DC352|nr:MULTISPECIES: hypothetical protein [Burkholderia]MDN7428993.1 hypothetical protein [Burkholderia sp. AU45388]MDN7553122.1 hypothetical protein [Burkholderia vietnamiensis]HDR9093344.1 hypothetical protein [Burkholderia vietnamiensis]
MVTTHYGHGLPALAFAAEVVDDFRNLWDIGPTAPVFWLWNAGPFLAAMDFKRSGEVH